jgi:hypothetical protein
MGLRRPSRIDSVLADAHRHFFQAATTTNDPEASFVAAQRSLAAATTAGDVLIEAYTSQVFQNRLSSTPRLPTHLASVIDGEPASIPWLAEWTNTFNACQIVASWGRLAPAEGRYRWELLDAQLAWCQKQKLPIEVGPLVDLRPGALPDWIWLWEGDFETISGLVADFVRQTVQRYKGRVPLWHVIHRPAGHEILGLTEEEQIRIAARAIQVARQADPAAQVTLGIDRPWAEWMGSSGFQLGPLHLADYLVRADLGLSALSIEIAPGFSSPGSHLRDLFEFSKLLDLYALLNLPLHIWMVMPSADSPDPMADPNVVVDSSQWPGPPSESIQESWASRWISLAIAKPFVRSVTWLQADDSRPHLYPNGGLRRANHTEKPLAVWLRRLRHEILA